MCMVIVGMLECWTCCNVGMLDLCNVGMLKCWNVGMLDLCNVGHVMHGALMFTCNVGLGSVEPTRGCEFLLDIIIQPSIV